VANPSAFYFEVLYPFQDRVLNIVNKIDTGFYLTGGTASSRGCLQHRFSDDLDFFVNDDARLNLTAKEVALKLEFVNDVPARVGETQTSSRG